MIKQFKIHKYKTITAIICSIFFIFYFQILDYGLPYFINFDEITHIKSINYFYGFFTHANQNIHEPIYAPFIHFIVSGIYIFVKYVVFNNFNFNETVNFIYLNPNILFEIVRISSLIISTTSLIIFYLILKKLKINNFLSVIGLLSVSTSYLFMDISIVAGKNSILLFFFLLQYYLFLYYYSDLQKFNSRSYILFGLLVSLSWGINYWAATPGLYAIALLHLKKFKFRELQNFIFFITIFLILGVSLNLLISSDNFIDHLFSPRYLEIYDYENKNRIYIIISEFLDGINLIRTYEKFTLEFLLIIFLFIIFLKLKIDKNIIFLNFFLLFEPIILFALADYSHPHIRYLGPSIFLIIISICLIIESIKNRLTKISKNLTYFFLIIVISSGYNKINVLVETKKLVDKKFIQYEILDEFENKKSLFKLPYAVYRENLNTLRLYKKLLNKKIISLNSGADNKNNLSEIEKKIKIIKNLNSKNITPSSKKFDFFGGEFIIDDYRLFFNEISKIYDYYILDLNKKSDEYIFLKNNYQTYKIYNNRDITSLRSLTLELEKKFNSNTIKKINKIGSSFVVFKLKEDNS